MPQRTWSELTKLIGLRFFLAATESWLAFRLGFMDACVSLSAGVFAILSVGKLSPGAIGLSLSYAIVFSEHVRRLVRYHTANLQNLTTYVPIMVLSSHDMFSDLYLTGCNAFKNTLT